MEWILKKQIIKPNCIIFVYSGRLGTEPRHYYAFFNTETFKEFETEGIRIDRIEYINGHKRLERLNLEDNPIIEEIYSHVTDMYNAKFHVGKATSDAIKKFLD